MRETAMGRMGETAICRPDRATFGGARLRTFDENSSVQNVLRLFE
jgi:hypothetical protein